MEKEPAKLSEKTESALHGVNGSLLKKAELKLELKPNLSDAIKSTNRNSKYLHGEKKIRIEAGYSFDNSPSRQSNKIDISSTTTRRHINSSFNESINFPSLPGRKLDNSAAQRGLPNIFTGRCIAKPKEYNDSDRLPQRAKQKVDEGQILNSAIQIKLANIRRKEPKQHEWGSRDQSTPRKVSQV